MGLKDIFEPTEAEAKVVYEDGTTNYDAEADADADADGDGSPEMEHQAVPSATMCPYCGGKPTDASARDHQLSAVGYLHDDIQLTCRDCDSEWACGMPIGELDHPMAEDLYCDSCTDRFMRVHRVAPDWGCPENRQRVLIHAKCPNCFYFDKFVRECGPRGIALMGYPDITGSLENASEYGWSDGADE